MGTTNVVYVAAVMLLSIACNVEGNSRKLYPRVWPERLNPGNSQLETETWHPLGENPKPFAGSWMSWMVPRLMCGASTIRVLPQPLDRIKNGNEEAISPW